MISISSVTQTASSSAERMRAGALWGPEDKDKTENHPCGDQAREPTREE